MAAAALRRRRRWGRVAAFLGVALGLWRASWGVEVAANPGVPVKQLTRNELQAIFTMRLLTWPDGIPIRVFVLADGTALHAEFAKEKLGILPYVLRNYWDRMVFSGTGQSPVELGSPAEMRERLVITPGSIGYLPSELVDARVRAVKAGAP